MPDNLWITEPDGRSWLGPAPHPLDCRDIKQGIRRNFARRAASYDRHAEMQRLMAHGLVAAAGDSLARAGRILEIGCGTGYLTNLLRQANGAARLVALDLDAALVAAARRRLGPEAGVAWLVADGETPLRGSFDLIIANATFQWFTRPADTLAAYHHSLAPGGVLAFSTLGPQTFQELAESLDQAAPGPEPPRPPRRFPPRGSATGRPGPAACMGPASARCTGPGNGHRHASPRFEVSQSPPGHGSHQPPALPLFPPLAPRPDQCLSDRLRQQRRHPGQLRNNLGRGRKIIKTVCARTAEKSSCQ